MKTWIDWLYEDEQALVGTDPVTDRLLQRLARERRGVELMMPAYKASREGVWEAGKPTDADLEWAKKVMARPEHVEGKKRRYECQDRGGCIWEGPMPPEKHKLWPYLRCTHCRCTSEAWQHPLTDAR